MPKHYAINANVQRGSVTFNRVTSANAYFINDEGEQMYYDTEPIILFNIKDPAGTVSTPAFKGLWIKDANNKIIGITIRFSAKQKLTVDWVCFEF